MAEVGDHVWAWASSTASNPYYLTTYSGTTTNAVTMSSPAPPPSKLETPEAWLRRRISEVCWSPA